jgi:hypothetical protein
MAQPEQPVDGPPIFDVGNPFITRLPASLSAEVVRNPVTGGEMLALTMRVGNGTLSAILDKTEGQEWAGLINGKCGEISGLVLAPGVLKQ